MSAIHEMLDANAGEINAGEFYAEMTRLGYRKLLLDYALFGEIVAKLIARHNETLRENAALQAKIARALSIEAKSHFRGESERQNSETAGANEMRDEFRDVLTGGDER